MKTHTHTHYILEFRYQEEIFCSDEGMIGVKSEVIGGRGEEEEEDEEFACDVVLVVCKLVDLPAVD